MMSPAAFGRAIAASRAWVRTRASMRRVSMRPLVRAVVRDRRGSTAVEFALVATPFFFLIFAVIEIGLVFVANVCLANATLSISRQIRVGKITASGKAMTTSTGSQLNLTDFKKAICSNIPLVPNPTCLSQLQVDLRTSSKFGGQSSPNTGTSTAFNSTSFCFYSGSPGDIVFLRAYFLWDISTPVLLSPLGQVKSMTTPSGSSTGNFYVLNSSEVFRNEPNSSATNNSSGC